MDWLFGLFGAMAGFGACWMLFSAKLAKTALLKEKLHEAQAALEQASRERTQFHERAVTAEANSKALEKQLREQQEQLKAEFKNTAHTIFEDMSKKFSTHSEKQIGDLLQPMRERLGEFQKLVTESFTAHGKEQHTLKAEVEKFARINDGLTKALRGDVKAQGNWGEIVLERILEASGLRRGEDYIVQASEMGLTGESGNRLKPDVIVKLPDNKHIIIDAKVSLTAYDRYCSQPEETHLRDFLKSVRAHVGILEQKRYQDIEKLGTPDFVFMFMPIEGAFSFAMQEDPELQSYAWGKGIIIVPPTNLFANLRTVASLWNIDRQNKNTQEIARQGGRLYDKFASFVEDMQSIGDRLGSLQKTYDGAMNKLADGKDNLIRQAEKMKQLGAKTSKALPVENESPMKLVVGDDA